MYTDPHARVGKLPCMWSQLPYMWRQSLGALFGHPGTAEIRRELERVTRERDTLAWAALTADELLRGTGDSAAAILALAGKNHAAVAEALKSAGGVALDGSTHENIALGLICDAVDTYHDLDWGAALWLVHATDSSGIPVGKIQIITHWPSECRNRPSPCVVHRPSGHHMATWPLRWRQDTHLAERQCIHGVWHPDLDQFGYWRSIGAEAREIHECDDCCTPGDHGDSD